MSAVPMATVHALAYARTLTGSDPLRLRFEAVCAELEGLAAAIVAELDRLDGDPDLEPCCEDEGAQCDDEGFGQSDGHSECVPNYVSHDDQTRCGGCY